MFNSKENTQNKIETFIGEDCKISGNMNGSGILRIDGFSDGDINWKDDIMIGDTAVCSGNISCKNAFIAGRLKGNLICEETLTIESTGIINGDITIRNLKICNGGILDGKCTMIVPKNANEILE